MDLANVISNELKDYFPQPLLKITDQYIGSKICMDEFVYKEIVDIIANDILVLWNNYDEVNDRLINLLELDAVDLVLDVLDRANIKDVRFWDGIYFIMPPKHTDIFLNKYGDLIAKSNYINRNIDEEMSKANNEEEMSEANREIQKYKQNKLREYIENR